MFQEAIAHSALAFAETAAEVGVPPSQFERGYQVGTTLTWLCWYRAARAHAEATGIATLLIHTYLDG